ncbi:MAG: hypothetical protein OCD02_10940 [Spirochaetaceae bacterium]
MKRIYLIFIMLFISYNLYSQEIRVTTFSDLFIQIEPESEYELLRQRNYFRPEFNVDLLDDIASFNISGEFYYDHFDDQVTPDPFNILREFYFSFYLPLSDIFIGQKYITKGKADVFSPLNIFNASYKELLSLDDQYQSKLPEVVLELNYYLNDDSSLEFIYIPFPRTDYQGTGEIDITLNNIDYLFNKESDPYLMEDSHSFFLTYNLYGFNFDTQITYANYVDGNYNFLIDSDTNNITKIYNRVQTIGGSVSTSLGPIALTEELAFNLTENFGGDDIGIKNSDITLNTQLMHPLFGRTYAQINIIYQYIFDFSEDGELEAAINDVHLQPTDNILFFIAHLHDSFFREKLYIGLNLGFFFSDDIYVAPRINYSVSDNITIESGINMFTGSYENKLLENNLGGDTLFLRIKYQY